MPSYFSPTPYNVFFPSPKGYYIKVIFQIDLLKYAFTMLLLSLKE